MTALLRKEFKSALWPTVSAIVSMVLLLFLNHGRWNFDSGWSVLVVLPIWLLGLRAYSEELSKGTIGFLYTRPVPWWKPWLAKLVAGVCAILAVTVMAGITYTVTAPAAYRPFLWKLLLDNAGEVGGILATFYAFGLVMSAVLPGLMLSIAGFAGGFSIFMVIYMSLESYLTDIDINPYILPWAMFASVIAAHFVTVPRLTRLSTGARLSMLGIFLAGGMLLGIAADMYEPWGAKEVSTTYSSLSPNGRWVVRCDNSFPHKEGDMEYRLVDTRTGRSGGSLGYEMNSGVWSPDSRRFAYLDLSGTNLQMTEPDGSASMHVRATEHSFCYIYWSPNGKRIAATDYNCRRATLVDVASGKSHTVRLQSETLKQALAVAEGDPVLVKGRGELVWPRSDR